MSDRPDRLQVSLVVPVRNEAARFPTLWRSIEQQTLPPDEILIVDGGSDDGTAKLARALAGGDPRVRVLEIGPAFPGRGRNAGIQAARNDWIALTDGGIALEPTWLSRLVEVAKDQPTVGVVYGHYEPITTTFFERCSALAYVDTPRDTPAGRMRGPAISSTLLHRSVWEAAGGFPDLRSTEDLIFFSRVESSGIKVGWAPEAVVHWELRPTLGSMYERFRLYSTHSVLAGRQNTWQYPVARNYLAAAPFLALALRRHRSWAAVPLAGAFARVGVTILRRREGRSARSLLNPVQFIGVGVIMLVIDAATFAGWARAILIRERGAGRRGLSR